MPSVRWRKVWADLTANKTRTLLVVLSIATGVLAVGAILSAQQVLSREMMRDYLASNPTELTIYASGLTQDMVQAVSRMPEIEAAEGRTSYNVRIQTSPEQWQDVQLTAPYDWDVMHLNTIEPYVGDWPPPKHQLLVERASLASLQANIGDTVVLQSPSGLRRELEIAGTVKDASQVSPQFQWMAAAYVDARTLAWLDLPDGMTMLFVSLKQEHPTRADVNATAERIQAKLEASGLLVGGYWVPEPGKHPVDSVIQPVFMILGILGLFALGLAGFLVLNTVSAIMSQQMVTIGIMKAVGARRRQILALYLVLVAGYGALALVLALPIGALAAKSFVDSMAKLLNVDVLSYWAPTRVYLAQAAVALLIPVLAALPPVLKGVGVTVRQATQSYGLSGRATKHGLLDRVLLSLRGVPRPLLLSLRNTFRRKGRLALTLVTLSLAGAIFIAVIAVRASMMATLDEAFDYFNYDVGLQFGRPHRVAQIMDVAGLMPAVSAAECWGSGRAERVLPEGGTSIGFALFAPPADTVMIRPTVVEGRWLLPEDENAIVVNSFVQRDDPDVQVGDWIVLQHNRNGVMIERDWLVVGVVRGVMTGPIAYVNDGYYARIMGRTNQAYSVRIKLNDAAAADQRNMGRALEKHFEAHGLRVAGREVLADQQVMIANQLMIIIASLLFMAFLFAGVGGLGVMGTMSINVLERTREIGVMRAVGANDRTVLGIVVGEGLIIGLTSWCLSAVLSWPLANVLTEVMGDAVLHSPITHVFPMAGAITWLGLALALAGLASLVPARRATSLTVRDVLAYQ